MYGPQFWRLDFDSRQRQRIFFLPYRPDQFWGPLVLLSNGYQRWDCWDVKLTTYLHLLPRSRRVEFCFILLQGVVSIIKHRHKFILLPSVILFCQAEAFDYEYIINNSRCKFRWWWWWWWWWWCGIKLIIAKKIIIDRNVFWHEEQSPGCSCVNRQR
jgi:hypothetical protein